MKKKSYLTLFLLLFSIAVSGQKDKITNYNDFNFWIGSWKVYKTGTDSLIGYSKVSSILSGYAISENYESPNNSYKGTSLSKYNPASKQWEQFWVDNSGLSLYLTGNLLENKMIFSGTDGDTLKAIKKITWEQLSREKVRQVYEESSDNGQTWLATFDREYRRRNF